MSLGKEPFECMGYVGGYAFFEFRTEWTGSAVAEFFHEICRQTITDDAYTQSTLFHAIGQDSIYVLIPKAISDDPKLNISVQDHLLE